MMSFFNYLLRNIIGSSIIIALSLLLFASAESGQVNYYKSIMDYPLHILVQIDITT